MILLGSSLERAIVNDMFLVFEVMKVKSESVKNVV